MRGWQVGAVADYPERWKEQTPQTRALFNREYTFGVANEAERLRQGSLPASARATRIVRDHPLDHRPWQCRAEARTRPLHGRTLMHLRLKWANRDHHLGDFWHRAMCRTGRHEIRGGEQMQLGSRVVRVERRCRWCDATPTW